MLVELLDRAYSAHIDIARVVVETLERQVAATRVPTGTTTVSDDGGGPFAAIDIESQLGFPL